jgi:hypothetical protein
VFYGLRFERKLVGTFPRSITHVQTNAPPPETRLPIILQNGCPEESVMGWVTGVTFIKKYIKKFHAVSKYIYIF